MLKLVARLPAAAEHFDHVVARRIAAQRTGGHRAAVGTGEDDTRARFAQMRELRVHIELGLRSFQRALFPQVDAVQTNVQVAHCRRFQVPRTHAAFDLDELELA